MPPSQEAVRERLLSNGYNPKVETFRLIEYPQLSECTYLDHAGTTLYAASAITAFSANLCVNLYGNPHSRSLASRLSSNLIDNIRHRVLRFFNADPQKFDVIFCANATAGMKLVAEAFSALEGGFEYKYHGEAHTSLIGLREVSRQARCLMSDTDVAEWLTTPRKDSKELGIVGLFGWPGQSNFNGRRFPSTWARELRNTHPEYYSLFDAASLVSSAPLDLSDSASAPDFTVLSFYKVFGFPDLGALIVRRDSCEILKRRRYFGGGTVESLIASTTDFVARKDGSPHSYLEDGTLPFLSIVALDAAMDTYERLYGGPGSVSKHIFSLGKLAYELLSELRHTNGQPLCVIYGIEDYNSPLKQGATIAFNLKRADGSWIGYVEVEKLASVKTIHIRVGSHCNPGGMENYVGLKPWEIRQNHATGQKCSDDNDIIGGKPTGAIRISLGAMSTLDDILTFIKFLEEFYVDQNMIAPSPEKVVGETAGAVVENLTIYPIKSCGGYQIPLGISWEIRPYGLAWDREWCLVHLGTGSALGQKAYPKMTSLRPAIDTTTGTLTIRVYNQPQKLPLHIPLYKLPVAPRFSASRVCGDRITTLTYDAPEIVEFFSTAVGVECTLARLPSNSTTSRNWKPHLNPNGAPVANQEGPKILLSNESPILIVNRHSLDSLNRMIASTGGKQAGVDVFRANIVLSSSPSIPLGAYDEDLWEGCTIGDEYFDILGPCRRCHMVSIDQETAEKNEEPFVTLSKTRTINGRVLFGVHSTHACTNNNRFATIRVGDVVQIRRKSSKVEKGSNDENNTPSHIQSDKKILSGSSYRRFWPRWL